LIDAAINFALGILLLLSIPFSDQITGFLGVPKIQHAFYPSIMGGVLIGIGIALLMERYRNKSSQMIGLGLGGAIVINLSGGLVLLGWLIFGDLYLPIRGLVFLWMIAILLVGISITEWIANNKHSKP